MSQIKLVHYEISPDINLPEYKYLTLVIENKVLFYKYVSELFNQIEKSDDNDEAFNLIINNKNTPIHKTALGIFSLYNISFNTKTIQTLVLKKLGLFLKQTSQFENKANLESIMSKILEDFRYFSDLNIDYDCDISESQFSKITNLKIIEKPNTTLLEKICSYINLMIQLKNIKIVILLFAKEYMTENELEMLNNFCIEKECKLLNIEQNISKHFQKEDLYIIDNDRCTIC